MLRSQITSLDSVIEQTSAALRIALFPGDYAPARPAAPPERVAPPPQQPFAPPRYAAPSRPVAQPPQPVAYYPVEPRHVELELEDLEAIETGIAAQKLDTNSGNVRFNDFRIPQAATIVLREAGHALHVSEIYQRMAEGGFEFRGQHQLITLAVSLSRAKRFRKVAPGTFELEPRYAAGQVA